MTIAIIGAGAAGCFAAIEIKRRQPKTRVIVCESGRRALAKVAITGGGRCNLTNTFTLIDNLSAAYPRGDKLLRRALSAFSERDVWEWFEREGIKLVAQEDQCVFPKSQDAMQIVTTLLRLMDQLGVELRLNHRATHIDHHAEGYTITFADDHQPQLLADRLLVTTGGQPRAAGFDLLASLQLKIVPPVPSLFTFSLAGQWHTELMGTVVEDASVSLAGTRHKANGPLLLTHWGMSGPAILRLSSYAARTLAERNYKATLVVNWLGGISDDAARDLLHEIASNNQRKLITTTPPASLTSRFWLSLLQRYHLIGTTADATSAPRWAEVGKKQLARLVTALTADTHDITNRCAFKEEFVTCGGVALTEVNPLTMESRQHPGLFFAGEVLDIDAITGGFNLQAAWSTGYVAATHISTTQP